MAEALGTVVPGVYGVSDLFVEQRKYDKDKSKFFIWRERGFAPMVHVLISAIKKETVTDPEPKHFEDGYRTFSIPLTGLTISALSGTAPELRTITFTADQVKNFALGQVWENPLIYVSDIVGTTTTFSRTRGIAAPNSYFKTEKMEVITISGNDVTFRRHIGVDAVVGVSVAPATTDTLYLHAVALTDGAGPTTSFAQNPVVVNNFVQVFGEPYEITDIAESTNIFGENTWQARARAARKNFARQIERAYLSGAKYSRSDGGETKWFTGGLHEWVPEDVEHRINLGSKAPTMTYLNTTLKDVFLTGSSEKWGFCGYSALTKIGNTMADHIRYNDKLSETIGLPVKSFETSAGGILHLVADYEMSQTAKDDEMLIADISYLAYMYMQGKDISIDKGKEGTGLQQKGEKKTKHQIYGVIGLMRKFRDSHFHLYGF